MRLGGHDSVGEAFVEFQKSLKHLMRRGVLLAIASKNDESVALEAIDSHGEMVLHRDDFVAWRINWGDKATNIAEMVAALNLGLQSVVFIDDNPHERARVREALPEVLVPEWPTDPAYYSRALLSLTCFDSPTVSAEDLARNDLYAAERGREALYESIGSLDEWIRDLEVVVVAERLRADNLPRAAQLLNKTNQMNLTTRRLTEAGLSDWASTEGHVTWCISVADRLGDAGLTGIISVSVEGDTATLVDYVLSCRVLGRRVEQAMAHLAGRCAADLSARTLVATLIPTTKNGPCKRFFDESGFRRTDEHVYEWDLGTEYPPPADVTIEAPAATVGRRLP